MVAMGRHRTGVSEWVERCLGGHVGNMGCWLCRLCWGEEGTSESGLSKAELVGADDTGKGEREAAWHGLVLSPQLHPPHWAPVGTGGFGQIGPCRGGEILAGIVAAAAVTPDD